MRPIFRIFLFLSIFLLASNAANANDFDGTFAAGLGGGFGDEDVGSIVVSGKYWANTFEIGSEMFWSPGNEKGLDQFGLIWLAIRQDLHVEEDNSTYAGMGGALMFEKNSFENDFGYIALLGWDGGQWGFEFKYGYFDPSIYSVVTYWNF